MPFQRYIYFFHPVNLFLARAIESGDWSFISDGWNFFYFPSFSPSPRNVEFTIFDYRNELKRRGLKKQNVLFDRISLNGDCWNCGYKVRLTDSSSSMNGKFTFCLTFARSIFEYNLYIKKKKKKNILKSPSHNISLPKKYILFDARLYFRVRQKKKLKYYFTIISKCSN